MSDFMVAIGASLTIALLLNMYVILYTIWPKPWIAAVAALTSIYYSTPFALLFVINGYEWAKILGCGAILPHFVLIVCTSSTRKFSLYLCTQLSGLFMFIHIFLILHSP